MQYNKFGKQDMCVSRFGMGCMRLPQIKNEEGNDVIDENESIKMIRHAIDSGVNYFDTAYAYAGSEEILGKALKDGYREKVMIATKSPVWDGYCIEDYQRFYEEQLRRLQVDIIDVYIFHCLDRINWEKVKKAGGIAFMEGLKREGKIKHFGFSFHADYELFEEIVDSYSWDMCLIQLNILDQNHQAGLRGLKYAGEKGISVVIMEPLKGGLLGGNPPEEVKSLLSSYEDQRSLVEWSFRWLYHHPQVKCIISGVSSMEQLDDNLRIFEKAQTQALKPSDFELIDHINAIYKSKVRIGCTGCGYCMPCPVGVSIPEIFKIYNDASLSTWSEFGKVFYGLVAANSGKGADLCVECGNCESQCPQKLEIIETLKEAHEKMKS